MQKFKNRLLNTFIIIYGIICLSLGYFQIAVDQGNPTISRPDLEKQNRIKIAKDFYRFNNNWLRKNKWGLWEMYLEGNGYERGLAHGKLTKELIEFQEQVFVDKINQLVPSPSYIRLLRNLIAWFNRDMESYIPQEYKDEIYGISKSCNPRFNYIGPAYRRILNFHGAHDIGHALQNLALVGCTSFAVNQNDSNNNLVLGRNFDFYVSDDFAKNVIVTHINPTTGHSFTYITWASFIGVASGINDQGLTVTINAAKSTYPTESAMPISLLAREILQYASNIDEAIAIAHKRKLFVSESIHIGSANDNTSAIIEKTPNTLDVFRNDKSYLVCANHFQGELLGNTELNKNDMAESPSVYRQKRCEQLIQNRPNPSITQIAEILRDRKGVDNENIGDGNEKAMNQLISHHSVIFEPSKQILWVSTQPYQLGEYLAYSNSDFKAFDKLKVSNKSLEIDSLKIPSDTFLYSKEYQRYKIFKEKKSKLQTALFKGDNIDDFDNFAKELIANNPNYYYGYMIIADYYFEHANYKKAKQYYQKSLELEVEHRSSTIKMEKRIQEITDASKE
jgi:hypothetical protein